jgi:hypothetical protein
MEEGIVPPWDSKFCVSFFPKPKQYAQFTHILSVS